MVRPDYRPLIVRLPNWVGDVVMALPALARLDAAGYALRLVGKRWALALLAGHPWPVTPRSGNFRERVAQLQRLRAEARAVHAAFDRAPNTVLLTNSFGSALEARLAGLRPLGYRQDARGWLLARAVPQPAAPLHESGRFDHLAAMLCTVASAATPIPRLAIAPAAAAAAEMLLARHGLTDAPFACLVPFATGTLGGASKAWPGFPALAKRLATRLPVVVVPGPGEVAQACEHYPQAVRLDDVDLGVYAALLARAALVVANDTGPGHVAAAVGAPLVSVLGPTDVARYGARGPQVTVVRGTPWPGESDVDAAVEALLERRTRR